MHAERVWQLQDAKAKFSAFVKASLNTPQIVSVRGEPKAIMVSLHHFRQASKIKPSLTALLESIPCRL